MNEVFCATAAAFNLFLLIFLSTKEKPPEEGGRGGEIKPLEAVGMSLKFFWRFPSDIRAARRGWDDGVKRTDAII